jgi:hypothetical protein
MNMKGNFSLLRPFLYFPSGSVQRPISHESISRKRSRDLGGGLLGSFPRLSLLHLGDLRGGLDADLAAAPVTPYLLEPVVEVGLDGFEQLVVLVAILRVRLHFKNQLEVAVKVFVMNVKMTRIERDRAG